MKNPFTKHPSSINETYLTHLIHALGYSALFLFLAIITFIHSFFPFLFVNTASTIIKKLNKHLEKRLSNSD